MQTREIQFEDNQRWPGDFDGSGISITHLSFWESPGGLIDIEVVDRPADGWYEVIGHWDHHPNGIEIVGHYDGGF